MRNAPIMPPSPLAVDEAESQRRPAVRGDEVLAGDLGPAVDLLGARVCGHRGDQNDRHVPDCVDELFRAAEVDSFDLGAVAGAQVVGAVDDRGHVVRQRGRKSILEGVGHVVPVPPGAGADRCSATTR